MKITGQKFKRGIIFLFIGHIVSINGFGQDSIQIEIYNGFELFQLGNSINKFDSLVCAEERTQTKYYNIDTTNQCQSYDYLPAKNKIIKIGDTRFITAALHIDTSTREINGVTLENIYTDKAIENPTTSWLDDFKKMMDFLKIYFGSKPKNETTKYDDNEYYSSKIYSWTKNRVKYILTATQFPKRYDSQILSYTLSLDYHKKK